MNIGHLSYSSISTYQLCPRAWKFRYIEKIPSPPSEAMAFGSVFHSTIEAYLKNGGKLNLHWKEQLEEKLDGNDTNFDAETQDHLYTEGLRMFSEPAIQQGVDEIKPMRVGDEALIEMKIEMHVPHVPIPIIGYIDVIEEDQVPGDFKTSKGSWNEKKAAGELQPLFYLGALKEFGVDVPANKFRHYVFVKTKTPKFQKIETQFNPAQQPWLEMMIANVWRGIENEVFFENPGTWKCSQSYCEYWSLCRGKF